MIRNLTMNLTIALTLETKKKLCVGAGGVPLKTVADVNFLRLGNSLVIPASTIKGVLRTCMIKVSRLLGYDVKPFIHPDKISKDIVTDLMGRPNSSSRIRVSNILLNHSTFTLSHVKINDIRRVAEEGGLFSMEYIRRGLTFQTKIEAFNINKDELRLLLAALIEMKYTRTGKGGLLNVRVSEICPNKNSILSMFDNDKVIEAMLDILMGDGNENISS